MVDLLRGYPPSVGWLDSVKHESLALPGYVVMELLEGCSNRRETDRVLKFIRSYRVFWPGTRDCNRAIADFAVGRLSRKLGTLDVLIAECAVGLDLPLRSFNVKHFEAIPGLRTIQPYFKAAGKL